MKKRVVPKTELEDYAEDLAAFGQEVKGVSTGRFKWEKYPVPARASEVRKVRSELHVSREELAVLLGVSPITVKSWEIGQRFPDGPATKWIRFLLARPGSARQLSKI